MKNGETARTEGLRVWGALLAVMAAGAFLRVWGYAGFVGLDDSEYARYAFKMMEGTFEAGKPLGPLMFPTRVAIIFPTFVSFELFGINDVSVGLYPLVISLLSIALVFVYTRHLFGWRPGLVAAAMLAVSPMELVNATRLFPDLPAAFFMALGTTVLVMASDARTARGSTSVALGAAAGLAFGVSWLTKESFVYLAPFIIAMLVITLKADLSRNLRLWAGVAIGSLGVLFAEMAVYHAVVGDPLFRFHEMERLYEMIESGFFTEGSKFGWRPGEGYARALVKRLFKSGPETIFLNPFFLYIPALALLASAYAAVRRDGRFLVTGIWFVSIALMYNFGSSSTASYMPLALLERYLYPVLFPAIVLTAGLLDALLFGGGQAASTGPLRRERLFWGWTLVAFICLVTLPVLFNHARSGRAPRGWAEEGRHLAALLRPTDRVYADRLSMNSLEFYWGYPHSMGTVNFEGMDSSDGFVDGEYLILHARALKWLNDNAGMWLNSGQTYARPRFADAVPASWERVWSNDHAALYRVKGQAYTASDGTGSAGRRREPAQ